ncbi:putative enzyme involved in biosynthesis of extracellular polysaccharides [Shewanella psychrophila]|uniref:Putative enzyme involved in biosynthesis of extracellular polysaccharides n=1 Tax=Shewanella psychrophila TaxID=225848 RepID=A0A1S6HPG1_9GAMM|nr:antibiotic biosynthesis monooxygenase [Shewanella psychrophila]AQS37389.1 putative enzyme involved in biosynthesis of extracellular polysaccharides [Shewanella psychrophila]
MILEVAILDVKPHLTQDFEAAFEQAQKIISGMKGYTSHQLQKCLEKESRYILLVNWQTLEDHTCGFRGSSEYQEWRALLHHFYDPFPEVEHYQRLY